MTAIVVVGAQWGDEGKGKIVDVLTQNAQWVVRFQGGNNAGHTIVIDGVKTALSLLPSGIMRPGVRSVLGAGVVLNPSVLISEIERVRLAGIEISPATFLIDRDAHLVLDYHIAVDKARERQRGPLQIGTTGRGIGPAYEDRSQRSGLRVADLLEPTRMKELVSAHVEEKNKLLKYVLGSDMQVDFESLWAKLEIEAGILAPFIGNCSKVLYEAMRRGENVVFEGAQGVLLDQMHGTYPYVTSSSTVAGAALIGAGLGPREIHSVLGVAKAYCTRVGEGPFPSEMEEHVAEEIRNRGREFGTVTGRARRCGWFDALAIKRAIRVSGIDTLILTKLDVLTGLRSIKVCVGYELDGRALDDVPDLLSQYGRLKPNFIELPGWNEDITGIRRWEDLPSSVRAFVTQISKIIECPISMVSVGPGREATVAVDIPATMRGFWG